MLPFICYFSRCSSLFSLSETSLKCFKASSYNFWYCLSTTVSFILFMRHHILSYLFCILIFSCFQNEWANIVSRNYFMVRGKHFIHSVLPWFFLTSRFFSFIFSTYSMLDYICDHSSHSEYLWIFLVTRHSHSDAPSSGLTQAVSLVTQHHMLPIFSTYNKCLFALSDIGYCLSTPYQVFGLTLHENMSQIV